MTTGKILRFNPNGPTDTGLEEWDPIDPADLIAGTPVQRGHLYHEDAASGYMAGVWDCTPMTLEFGPYPENEFMFLLEGSVIMVLENGDEITVNAGESFIIPKGLPCQWKQECDVRKYFMIFGDPDGQPPADVSSLGIILPKPEGPGEGLQPITIEDPSLFIGDVPTQHDHIYYADPSNQFICGVWDSTPFEAPAQPFPRNELMIVLEGTVTLTDEDGKEHLFKAGDTAYVAKGTVHSWKSSENVRKFYCVFEPS